MRYLRTEALSTVDDAVIKASLRISTGRELLGEIRARWPDQEV